MKKINSQCSTMMYINFGISQILTPGEHTLRVITKTQKKSDALNIGTVIYSSITYRNLSSPAIKCKVTYQPSHWYNYNHNNTTDIWTGPI